MSCGSALSGHTSVSLKTLFEARLSIQESYVGVATSLAASFDRTAFIATFIEYHIQHYLAVLKNTHREYCLKISRKIERLVNVYSSLTQWLSVSFLYLSLGTNMAFQPPEVMRKSRVRISQGVNVQWIKSRDTDHFT